MHDSYLNYGGRGIIVCDRWLGADGYKNFLADVGKRPSPKHTLDRRNNNGNYEPGNCSWATAAVQCRNRRNNRIIAYKGKTLCAADWAEELGINRKTLYTRLRQGWPVERALTESKQKWKQPTAG
jgi:hypothetical protein